MLVSAADLSFVAAAVQSWSLPHLSVKDTTPILGSRATLQGGLVALLLVVVVNIGQLSVASGSLAGRVILGWIGIELLYLVYWKIRYSSVNKVLEVPLDVERTELIKERFLTLASVMNMEAFLSGWFQGEEDIRRRNVEEFVAYGFYCRRLEHLAPKLQDSVAAFVREVERQYGRELDEGHNPDIKFMAHMWEPLRTLPTLLSVHLTSLVAGGIAHIVLKLWGFEKRECQGLAYWHRKGLQDETAMGQENLLQDRSGVQTRSMTSVHARGDSASSLWSQETYNKRPLIFIHGVGFGVAPYLGFLWLLCRSNAMHPIFLLDIPHVALRPFTRAKNIDSIASAVQQMLAEHKMGSACFVGHSFGSFCISRICQLYPAIVDSIALMDPVCCMTCYPQLLSSFIYKGCTLHDAFSSMMGFMHTLRYIFSRDLIIAETFCRQFLWHSLMLWPEDMPEKSLISTVISLSSGFFSPFCFSSSAPSLFSGISS